MGRAAPYHMWVLTSGPRGTPGPTLQVRKQTQCPPAKDPGRWPSPEPAFHAVLGKSAADVPSCSWTNCLRLPSLIYPPVYLPAHLAQDKAQMWEPRE